MSSGKLWRSVKPSNANANNTYSHSNGYSQLVFPMSAIEQEFLKGSSVRLCGKLSLRLFNADDGSLVDNIEFDTVAKRLYTDWRIGAYSCFQQLAIRSLQGQQEIETIDRYNQLMTILHPVLHSQKDYETSKSNDELACNQPNQSIKFFESGTDTDGVEQSFALRVYSGLLYNSEPIPMGTMGGLEMTFRLDTPQQVLTDLNETAGGGTNGIGAEFVIRDPELQYEVLRMPNPASDTFSYSSIASFESVVNSGNHSAVYNIGNAKGVRSVIAKFVPTNFLNTYGSWGFSCGDPRNSTSPVSSTAGYEDKATIRKLTFFLGGRKAPYDFSITKQTGASGYLKSEIIRNGLDAVREFVTLNHTIPDARIRDDNDIFINQNRTLGDGGGGKVSQCQYASTYKGGELFVVGANYSPYGRGMPMNNETLTIELESDIADTLDSPNTMFIYMMQENELSMRDGRVNVSS